LPAVTLGGLVNGNGQTIYGTSIYQNKSSTEAGYFDAVRNAANAGAGFVWRTFNNLDAITTRMQLSSGVATAILTLSNVTVNGLVLDGALTLNGQAFDAGAGSAEINTTGGGHGLTITSTQDGASGASLQLYQNSASPAASDVVGDILFYGEDSVGNKELYGRQRCEITDPTSTSEESAMKWTMVLGGTANLAMTLSGAGVLSPDHSIMFGQSQDSAAVADQVSLGGYEISAGHRALAISSEEVVVAAAAGASDAYLPVRINGVTYKLLLHN